MRVSHNRGTLRMSSSLSVSLESHPKKGRYLPSKNQQTHAEAVHFSDLHCKKHIGHPRLSLGSQAKEIQ